MLNVFIGQFCNSVATEIAGPCVVNQDEVRSLSGRVSRCRVICAMCVRDRCRAGTRAYSLKPSLVREPSVTLENVPVPRLPYKNKA